MGNWISGRKSEAMEDEELKPEEQTKGSQAPGRLKFFRRSQWASKETPLTSREILYQDLDPIPKEVPSAWGQRGARLRRAAQRSCPPLSSWTLWISGDGGEREENHRYHRLMGTLVSSMVAEEDLPPPTWYVVPRDHRRGPPPPPPLRYVADGEVREQGNTSPYLSLNQGE
ncbi:hypothetical protein NXF25_021375 [Crotalus adamanteus]|uniref:Uncharacterized protein n=1 Tax=Crotalus adamanteus TaxID=8729 RepID=A0AAW1B7L3_CROAD